MSQGGTSCRTGRDHTRRRHPRFSGDNVTPTLFIASTRSSSKRCGSTRARLAAGSKALTSRPYRAPSGRNGCWKIWADCGGLERKRSQRDFRCDTCRISRRRALSRGPNQEHLRLGSGTGRAPFQHRQSMRHSLYLDRYSVNSCHPVPRIYCRRYSRMACSLLCRPFRLAQSR